MTNKWSCKMWWCGFEGLLILKRGIRNIFIFIERVLKKGFARFKKKIFENSFIDQLFPVVPLRVIIPPVFSIFSWKIPDHSTNKNWFVNISRWQKINILEKKVYHDDIKPDFSSPCFCFHYTRWRFRVEISFLEFSRLWQFNHQR